MKKKLSYINTFFYTFKFQTFTNKYLFYIRIHVHVTHTRDSIVEFNATFNNISVKSCMMISFIGGGNGVPGENLRSATSQ